MQDQRSSYSLLSMAILAALILMLAAPQFVRSQDPRPFKVLVVGDSHIAGQGLREEHKFYYLVWEWLQKEAFGGDQAVDLKVKAHAGSRISLHPDEVEKMTKAGDDIHKFQYMEANISSPSITEQIDIARREYEDPNTVDMVMLSGCITDVLVADIVSPFYPKKKLRERIHRFCGESMYGLLEHVSAAFPKAQIVVVGYFPIASPESDVETMAIYFSEMVNVPDRMQFFFTNSISRQFLKPLRNQIAKRSRLWVDGSNREIQNAIARINARSDKTVAYFVESPISESSSYGTKEPLLWQIEKHRRALNDETYLERKAGCAKVFGEIKYHHYGRLSQHVCELSSVAHPNVAGSRAFADAITDKLRVTVFHQANLGSL